MAGRSRQPGSERRTERTAVRWTPSEMERIKGAKERHQIQYEVDVIRSLTLKQLDLEEAVGRKADVLERVRQEVGLASSDDVVRKVLKQIRLDEEIGGEAAYLEKLQRLFGFESREAMLWALAKTQIESMSSALEKDVAE